MSETNFITLSDYSNKYRVSVSTLRRRIKNKKAEAKFVDGKYLLCDKPLHEHETIKEDLVPPQFTTKSKRICGSEDQGHKLNNSQKPSAKENISDAKPNTLISDTSDSPFLTTANNLLSEIKKAYSLVLQEKEEQIYLLKEEITNLQTLVKLLESDNIRLKEETTKNITSNKKAIPPQIPLDNWENEIDLDMDFE